MFRSKNMYLGMREIRQSACVVQIQMGHDNISDIFRLEAETGDLMHGSLIRIETRTANRDKTAPQMSNRIGNILEPQAGIHQDQSIIRLNEQAVADDTAC